MGRINIHGGNISDLLGVDGAEEAFEGLGGRQSMGFGHRSERPGQKLPRTESLEHSRNNRRTRRESKRSWAND